MSTFSEKVKLGGELLFWSLNLLFFEIVLVVVVVVQRDLSTVTWSDLVRQWHKFALGR